jgi:predicted transposase YdaD
VARRKYGLPVWSALILLRRSADGPELTGEYRREFPGRGPNVWFRYDVVRIWEVSVDRMLTAGLSVLPLAPIADVPEGRLPEVLMTVAERLRNETAPEIAKNLWMATEILLGLSHSTESVAELSEMLVSNLLRIPGIEESSVYQDIFAKGEAHGRTEGEARGRAEGEARGRAEGELDGVRKILIRLGEKRLGRPEGSVLDRIAAIDDLDRLNGLIDRTLEVSSWDELLAPAGSS